MKIRTVQFVILGLLYLGCKEEPKIDENVQVQKLEWELSMAQQKWVETTLANMTVEQKVGHLLAPAISASSFDSDEAVVSKVSEWIEKYKIGHVYVTGKPTPTNVAKTINGFQEKSPIPLMIHGDFEIGTGSRIDGGTIITPLMNVAQTRSEELSYKMASIVAKEARAMGFHLINSPVLDVNINSENPVICTRSFGDNPKLVADMGAAYVQGLSDHGLIGAAKHFPGHGDVSVDSHSQLPTIIADRSRLDSIEFYPYKKTIESGLMGIETAHISIPSLDSTLGLPATMSNPIITGILRKEMGFNGLIITDAFNMSALLDSGSFEESAVQSVMAGNDIVLLWTDPKFEQVFPHMMKAVQEGRISKSHLDKVVTRILEMKARLGLHKSKLVKVDDIPQKVNTPENIKVATEIQEKGIVLVKNEENSIPLPAKNKSIAVLSINDDEDYLTIGKTFINEMQNRGEVSFDAFIDSDSSESDFEKAYESAQDADVVVVALFVRVMAQRGSSSLRNENIINFLKKLSQGKKPVTVISFGSPYLISDFPEVDGYVVATEPSWDFYKSADRPGQVVTAKALFGESDITGKLAVSIPGLFPFGHGIELMHAD